MRVDVPRHEDNLLIKSLQDYKINIYKINSGFKLTRAGYFPVIKENELFKYVKVIHHCKNHKEHKLYKRKPNFSSDVSF